MKAYLNIGTNLGDRRANINRAVEIIELRLGCKAMCTAILESVPWGYDSSNSYYNMGLSVVTELSPIELLDTLQAIEREMGSLSHRTPEGEYADRLIDIDIMDIEGIKVDCERLTVPHVHLYDRDFFSIPYRELKEMEK